MYAGIHAARGDVIVLLDGDRQNDPADIPKLLAEIEKGADLVCGYRANRKDTTFKRVQSRSRQLRPQPLHRRWRARHWLHLEGDAHGVPRGAGPFYGMHRFIPALIKGMGYRLAEVPTHHRPRVAGVSKYGFGNRAWKATCDMFAVSWMLSRQIQIRIKRAD